jgi:hypothetical protein
MKSSGPINTYILLYITEKCWDQGQLSRYSDKLTTEKFSILGSIPGRAKGLVIPAQFPERP